MGHAHNFSPRPLFQFPVCSARQRLDEAALVGRRGVPVIDERHADGAGDADNGNGANALQIIRRLPAFSPAPEVMTISVQPTSSETTAAAHHRCVVAPKIMRQRTRFLCGLHHQTRVRSNVVKKTLLNKGLLLTPHSGGKI